MIESLLGRWNIQSWEQRYDDGRVTRPMGEHLEGYILYSPAGSMACFIARAARPRFASPLQWAGKAEEKCSAYDTLMAYGGRYTLQGDKVTHHVEVSLFPNWVGGEQVRQASIEADVLTISARLEAGTAEARTAVLIWRRAPSTSTSAQAS